MRRLVISAAALVLATLLPREACAQTAPAARVTAGPSGFTLESADGQFRLQIGGVLQADGRFAPGDDDGFNDTFSLRRVRASIRARLTRRIEVYLNPDAAGGTLALQDAYVDTVFSPAFRVRAGKAKSPFGFERLHSASNVIFINRGFPTSLAPNRDIGFQVLGDLSGGIVSYAGAILNGVADGGSADLDTADSKDLVGRVVVRPFRRRAGHPLEGFGMALAGSRGRQQGAGALPVLRTSTLERTFFSYSGASADGVRTRYSPQAFVTWKRVGAFAEYVRSTTAVREDVLREPIAHEAWQVAGSLALTGGPLTDAGDGLRTPAATGALQIAARYHALRVDPRAVALGFAASGASRKAEAWTVGLNWFVTANVRHILNVERTIFDDGVEGARAGEHAVAIRTQVSF